jgi:hypothetical protein
MHNIRFDVFRAVTMKNAVFWDVTTCGSYKNDVSKERNASIFRVTKIGELLLQPLRCRPENLRFKEVEMSRTMVELSIIDASVEVTTENHWNLILQFYVLTSFLNHNRVIHHSPD